MIFSTTWIVFSQQDQRVRLAQLDRSKALYMCDSTKKLRVGSNPESLHFFYIFLLLAPIIMQSNLIFPMSRSLFSCSVIVQLT